MPYRTSHLSDPCQTPPSFPDHGEVSLLCRRQDSVTPLGLASPMTSWHVPPDPGSSGPSHRRHLLQCCLNRTRVWGWGPRGERAWGPSGHFPAHSTSEPRAAQQSASSLFSSPEGKPKKVRAGVCDHIWSGKPPFISL